MPAPPTITPSPYAERGTPAYRRITYAMFLAGLCLFAQLYFLQPLLPVLGRYFRLTPAHSSLVISTATLALAAGLLLGTFLANRVARKKLMVSALLGSSVLTAASALAPGFAWMLLQRVFCWRVWRPRPWRTLAKRWRPRPSAAPWASTSAAPFWAGCWAG